MKWSLRLSHRRGSCIMTVLALLLLMLLWAAWARGCGEGMRPVQPLPGTGWTIGGAVLRESVDDLQKRLGKADKEEGPPGQRLLSFRNGDLLVTADGAGRVVRLWSTRLMQGPDVRVSAGMGEDAVCPVLGETRAEKHFRPKGNGVISVGSVHDSTTFRYQWGSDELEVYAYEGQVRAVTATVRTGGTTHGRH